MATLDDLKKLAYALKNGVTEQYNQGAPYRNALAQALQGNLQPADQLFNTPQPVNEQQAVDAAMAFSPMALGTIGKVASKLTPFEQNHLIAQKNAVEMLGLPANNTAMDRAKAMGYTTPAYHGTNADIHAFNTSGAGKTSDSGAFFSSNPDVAGTYTMGINNGNILPVLLRNENHLNVDANGKNWNRLVKSTRLEAPAITKIDNETENLLAQLEDRPAGEGLNIHKKAFNTTLGKKFPDEFKYDDYFTTDDLARWANKEGYGGTTFNNVMDRGPSGAMANEASSLPSNNYAVNDPSDIRSRFAAFDPAKRNQADIMGNASPELLALIAAGAGGGILANKK